MDGTIMKEIREGATILTDTTGIMPDIAATVDTARDSGGYGGAKGDPFSIIDSIIMGW